MVFIFEVIFIPWEKRKNRGLESKAAKRRCSQDDQEEDTGRRKNRKKLRFSLLREDWGESIAEEKTEEELVINTPPHPLLLQL